MGSAHPRQGLRPWTAFDIASVAVMAVLVTAIHAVGMTLSLGIPAKPDVRWGVDARHEAGQDELQGTRSRAAGLGGFGRSPRRMSHGKSPFA